MYDQKPPWLMTTMTTIVVALKGKKDVKRERGENGERRRRTAAKTLHDSGPRQKTDGGGDA